jgi:glutathione-regulated potassium-efflux system protein KefB
MIGFGRFAQVAGQSLLARGLDISIIENDPEMIQTASNFGFKVYYGDGTRLDILHASGAGNAEAILICIDDRAAANKIAELAGAEFPQARIFARAYDRGHAIELINAGVEYQLRETFESAMLFGETVLRDLGVPDAEVDDIIDDVRRRDTERLELQIVGGIYAGADLMRTNGPVPAPLTTPKRRGEVIGAAPGTAQTTADPVR